MPFLGACYGVGTLGGIRAGPSTAPWRAIGWCRLTLADGGRADPLLAGLPCVRRVPGAQGGLLPASHRGQYYSPLNSLPGTDVPARPSLYATQFHPELDADGLALSVQNLQRTQELSKQNRSRGFLIDLARRSIVTEPQKILAGSSAQRYARP